MTTERRKEKLDKLREKYRSGRINAETYVKVALSLRDGCETRKAIMRGAYDAGFTHERCIRERAQPRFTDEVERIL